MTLDARHDSAANRVDRSPDTDAGTATGMEAGCDVATGPSAYLSNTPDNNSDSSQANNPANPAEPAPPVPPVAPAIPVDVADDTLWERFSAPPSLLFDEIADAVLRFDRTLQVVYVNAAAIQSFGVGRAEMIGRRLTDVEPMRDFAPFWEGRIAAAFDTLEGRTFKFVYPYPTGAKNFEVRLYLEPDGRGEAGHVTAFARDITVPRSAMRANRANDSLVSTLMSSARTGMAVLDRNLRYILCNPYLTRSLGLESRDLLGRRLDEAFDLSAQPDVMRSLIRMRDNDLRVSHQVEYQFCGGDLPWVRERRTPLLNARGEFHGVFLTVDRLDRERFAETSLAALRQALERAGEMVLEIRPDGSIVDTNETALSWLGYSREQMTGMRLGAIDANLGSDRFAEVLQRLRACGTYHGETQYRTRAGTEFAVDVVLQRVEHGEQEFIFLLVRDISDRKRSEEELRRVRNHLDLVIDSLPVLVSVRDAATGRFVSMNRAGEALTGLSRQQVVGRSWHEIYGRQFADLYAELDRRALTEGRRIDRPRDVMLRTDGRALTVNQRVVPIFDDQADSTAANASPAGHGHPAAKYVMSIIDDLTDEVQTETALRETETRFRQFAENIDQVVFIGNADLTRIYFINDRYTRLVGGTVTAVLADPRSAMAYVHPDDRQSVDRQLPRLLADLRRLRPRQLEVRIAHPENGERWLSVRLNPARVHDGSVRVFGIADDATERRAAEQQRLDDAVKQRDILVREVHHRIKNNLQGVAGLLQQMASAKPEAASALNEIAGQIQTIAQVHGLQMGSGGTLPVLGMAQGIFANLGAMFGVEVRFESDSPELWRWVLPENEAVPIALVINELGTNAIKYRASRELPIQVRIDGTTDGLVVTIDNGGRLPPGFDLARIASGFSGLSLIKALLPRRGARLRIEALGPVVRAALELAPPAIREETE